MGIDKNHISFHFHLPHLHLHMGGEKKDIPKGCLTVLVGQGEEQQRFIVSIMDINHPLFVELLKEAEEEYGFEQKGPIMIPCHVEEFRSVQDLINREKLAMYHQHHLLYCFRV